MKKYILLTHSESGDDYHYFIQSSKKLTDKILEKWLMKNGSDVDEDTCYENIQELIEITDNYQII